jgi:tRNA(adenine34) deaminase
MNDEELMREALAEAQKTLSENEFPVGAIVVHNGTIIGRGRKIGSDYHLGHAEINALRDALGGKRYHRTDKLSLYTTVEPCMMCFGTILTCPIDKVVYAFEDPYGGGAHVEEAALPVRHHGHKFPKIMGGILRQESKRLLKQFLTTTDQTFWKHYENPLIKLIMG